MQPCGGGHSNPSPPLLAGKKMAAPGVAVAPGAALPGSPPPPLLLAEAPPGLDRGGRMPPQRKGPTAAASPSVSVVFPGTVSRESCCRFVCELLKHILHQRHQLPLPYEQLAFFCRPPQDGDGMKKPPSMDLASKKGQQALMDLERVLHHLEVMFSLTPVPRVLILLGGNVMSPKEFYELSFEGICEGNAEESLKTASCVRKLFHSLFVADVFSELKALPVMDTIVMIQGHRDCGVDWFHPKLNYKVPARGRKLTVNLSCDGDIALSASPSQRMNSTWEDYIWFQAPVTIKGFRE
ncbi:MAD2L1-binding protein [Phaethornis superciliosus]